MKTQKNHKPISIRVRTLKNKWEEIAEKRLDLYWFLFVYSGIINWRNTTLW